MMSRAICRWRRDRSVPQRFGFNPDGLFFFFFNDTATTEIYTLSLHDALPIFQRLWPAQTNDQQRGRGGGADDRDRKSTRLNSSHRTISYAVFCLKKKNEVSSILHAAQLLLRQWYRRLA